MIYFFNCKKKKTRYFSSNDEGNYIKSIDQENVKAAENLLKEIATKCPIKKLGVLQSYLIMFSKQKNSFDAAINKLNDILKEKQDYVPALLALAVAKFLIKKQSEAKTHLKTICKMNFSSEFTDEFEKAHLLLADTLISVNFNNSSLLLNLNFFFFKKKSSNNEGCEQLLKRCLKINESSAKAEEFLGLIKEKDQIYNVAVEHYERAWNLTNEKSAPIGLKILKK